MAPSLLSLWVWVYIEVVCVIYAWYRHSRSLTVMEMCLPPPTHIKLLIICEPTDYYISSMHVRQLLKTAWSAQNDLETASLLSLGRHWNIYWQTTAIYRSNVHGENNCSATPSPHWIVNFTLCCYSCYKTPASKKNIIFYKYLTHGTSGTCSAMMMYDFVNLDWWDLITA